LGSSPVNYDLAVEQQKTLEIDPNFVSAHGNLASIYWEMGKYDLWLEEWEFLHWSFPIAYSRIKGHRVADLDGLEPTILESTDSRFVALGAFDF
jgi:hypothetical protein